MKSIIFIASIILTISIIYLFYRNDTIRFQVGSEVAYCVPKKGYIANIFFLPDDHSSTHGFTAGGCHQADDKLCVLSNSIIQFDVISVENKLPNRFRKELENSVEYIELVENNQGVAQWDSASGFYVLRNAKKPKIGWWVWSVPNYTGRDSNLTLPPDSELVAFCSHIDDAIAIPRTGIENAKFVCKRFAKANGYNIEYVFALENPIPSRNQVNGIESSIARQLNLWRCE